MLIFGKIRIVFLVTLFLLSLPLFSLEAKSYDFYVDGSVSKSGDGSKSEPFKTVGEALKEIKKKSNSVFIKDGKYKENLELKNYTEIYGESENGVIISGEVIMGDKTLIRDITVRGSYSLVKIKKDADAEIKNCTLRDFEKIGIEALAGKGKLEVTDSKIKNGNGKGFYIQRGKEIEISNNEVNDNDEEGIDLRSKLTGSVKNNIIVNNGESGIELLVGSTDLKIIGNKVTHNGASGIATQFYPEHEKKGSIEIFGNKFEKNKKYGMDCNKPQGGSPSNSYWRDSIELEDNNINANKIKSINDYCKMIEAVDDEEEADNLVEESGYEEEEGMEEDVEPELTQAEQERIQAEEVAERVLKEQKLKEVNLGLTEQKRINIEVGESFEKLGKENKLKRFLFGPDFSKIDNLYSNLSRKEEQINRIETIAEEVFLETDEYTGIREKLAEERKILEDRKNALNNVANSFSIWGWILALF